jgi:hypothetical protein
LFFTLRATGQDSSLAAVSFNQLLLLLRIVIVRGRAKFDHEQDQDHEHEMRCAFLLAQRANHPLLSLRIMRLRFGKCVSILGGAAVMLICSCEEHHVGEMPEVQQEHLDLVSGSEDALPATRAASPSASPAATPTPGQFFPGSSSSDK